MADAAVPGDGAAAGAGAVPPVPPPGVVPPAAAGEAAGPPAVRDPMDVYLEEVIGVTHPGTRVELIAAGFTGLVDLVNAGKDFARHACEQVRSSVVAMHKIARSQWSMRRG